MNFLVIGTALVMSVAPAAQDTKAPNLDGNWTVVCMEKNGEAVADAKDMTVTAKDNTFICAGKEGKPAMTMKVTFGPNCTISVTEVGTTAKEGDVAPAAKTGVYVMTKDYFTICIHDDAGRRDGGTPPAAANAAGPQAKSYCSIILKRSDAK